MIMALRCLSLDPCALHLYVVKFIHCVCNFFYLLEKLAVSLTESPETSCSLRQCFSVRGPRVEKILFLYFLCCIAASFKLFSSHFLLPHWRKAWRRNYTFYFLLVYILFDQNVWGNFGDRVSGTRKVVRWGGPWYQKGCEGRGPVVPERCLTGWELSPRLSHDKNFFLNTGSSSSVLYCFYNCFRVRPSVSLENMFACML
jgi:hypothetical protein